MPGYRVAPLCHDDAPAAKGGMPIGLSPCPLGRMLYYEGDDGKTADVMHPAGGTAQAGTETLRGCGA